MDGPAGSAVPTPQPLHTGLLDAHLPLHHRAAGGWAPYLPPPTGNPASQFHSPPPGFQTAFRPPGQPTTELLQSAAVDRHWTQTHSRHPSIPQHPFHTHYCPPSPPRQYTPVCRVWKIINEITKHAFFFFSSPSLLSVLKADLFCFCLWYTR